MPAQGGTVLWAAPSFVQVAQPRLRDRIPIRAPELKTRCWLSGI